MVGMAALLASVAACDVLAGLGNYSLVPPADSGAADSMGIGATDAADENDSTTTMPEAGPLDASDASDVTVDDATPEAAPPPDVSVDAPSLVTLWAQWKMPNPDAAIAPDSSTLLPNQMSYQVNGDAGQITVTDLVTNLVWLQAYQTVNAPLDLATACPIGFHVPTRIQLVSLIDFTQPSVTINTATFPGVPADRFWTSSQVAGTSGSSIQYWTIDFSTGLTSTSAPGHYVLCLQGGP
jgi:hypothetical protein